MFVGAKFSGIFWPWPMLKHILAMHELGFDWRSRKNCYPSTFVPCYPIQHCCEHCINDQHSCAAKMKKSNSCIICLHWMPSTMFALQTLIQQQVCWIVDCTVAHAQQQWFNFSFDFSLSLLFVVCFVWLWLRHSTKTQNYHIGLWYFHHENMDRQQQPPTFGLQYRAAWTKRKKWPYHAAHWNLSFM